jgi:hypothetical protein
LSCAATAVAAAMQNSAAMKRIVILLACHDI